MRGEQYKSEEDNGFFIRFLFYAFGHGAEDQRNYHKNRHSGEREVKALNPAEAAEVRDPRQHKGLILLRMRVIAERKPNKKEYQGVLYPRKNQREDRLPQPEILCRSRQAGVQNRDESRRDKVYRVLEKVGFAPAEFKAVEAEIERAYAAAEHQNIRNKRKSEQEYPEPSYNIDALER